MLRKTSILFKSTVKRVLPASMWAILRYVKNDPAIVLFAVSYLKDNGWQKTLQKIKIIIHVSSKKAQPGASAPPRPTDYSVVKAPEKSSTTLKLAIVVHVYHLDKLPPILESLTRVPYPYALYFTVSRARHDGLLQELEHFPAPYDIVVLPNYGFDIYPFISVLPQLARQEIDVVCKLHTKKGAANLEELVKGIEDVWFNLLLGSVLGSEQTIRKIVETFEQNEDVGMLGSAALYKSAQKLMYGNEVFVTELLNLIDDQYDFAQDWGFFAGSMFWARMEILRPLLDNKQQLDSRYFITNSGQMKTGETVSVFHATERVFGALPKISSTRVALSYATDKDRTTHAIHVPSNASTYLSPVGIGTTLQNELHLKHNYQELQNAPEFNQTYYRACTPGCAQIRMDPLLHFLRYGTNLNRAPNANFSPFAYWNINPDVHSSRLNPLVHYVKYGRNRTTFPAASNIALAIQLLKQSKLFDFIFYLQEYPDVLGMPPLEHYCKYGWRERRRIGPRFDAQWYTSQYLRNYIEPVNPLLHYLIVGKKTGCLTRPRYTAKPTIQVQSATPTPKRICLFAAYDPDGLIDQSVIDYVRELARHADVYFLSDTTLQQAQLDKLAPYVKGGWGLRHGEYDFGSYKRLAKYLVGWDKIATYDELLLVNDSSYLLRPLDDVFLAMGKKKCSWWGLQATKGMSHTRHFPSNQFDTKIPIQKVKDKLLQKFALDPEYDFHIGSYFLLFRKPVLKGNALRTLLDNVKKSNKKNLILENEVGLTRTLINQGYDFDTYIPDLYPFHPVYTNAHFELIQRGFPLFKRFLLTENHYRVAGLWRWKVKLQELVPKIDLTPLIENLQRVADATKLYNNLHLQDPSRKLLSMKSFKSEDKKSSPDMRSWVFPVCAYDHLLTGNDRAVFELVKDDPTIRKIILFRSKYIDLKGENVHKFPLYSRSGQDSLLHSGVIFIKHTPRINTVYPLDPTKHKFINLWHGIPLKRIGVAAHEWADNGAVLQEHKNCHCVIASSAIDRMAMTAGFYPLTYHDIWLTGLPRNDFILLPQRELPPDFQRQAKELDAHLAGRKFILFAPTFRNGQELSYYHFTRAELAQLQQYLQHNDIIMGIREHMADKAHSYSTTLQGKNIIEVGAGEFPNIEVLYRRAHMLITDYSSCFIDFMLTGKPMISFAFDLKHYCDHERGLFYDLHSVFPGPICYDTQTFFQKISETMHNGVNEPCESYQFKRNIFFDYIDSANTQRLVDKVKDLQ